MNRVKNETATQYGTDSTPDLVFQFETPDETIERAMKILKSRMREPGRKFDKAQTSTEWFTLKMAEYEREVFAVVFLDNRHRFIGYEELFFGTIDGATVHSREVVKAALRLNAAAVILGHSHPSGNPEPSNADKAITQRLKDALALVDVRVLDHIVVGGTAAVSLVERGDM